MNKVTWQEFCQDLREGDRIEIRKPAGAFRQLQAGNVCEVQAIHYKASGLEINVITVGSPGWPWAGASYTTQLIAPHTQLYLPLLAGEVLWYSFKQQRTIHYPPEPSVEQAPEIYGVTCTECLGFFEHVVAKPNYRCASCRSYWEMSGYEAPSL